MEIVRSRKSTDCNGLSMTHLRMPNLFISSFGLWRALSEAMMSPFVFHIPRTLSIKRLYFNNPGLYVVGENGAQRGHSISLQ
eukprot:8664397-Ditylum_brightwellii.AAC.1